MRASLALAILLLTFPACRGKSKTPVDSGMDEEMEQFDGETGNSVLPNYEPGTFDAGFSVIDAGEIVVDTRCCNTVFRISDTEPVDATGMLQGESARAFGEGVQLQRTDAGWEASACFPINSSASYWYAFTLDAGFVDGGIEVNREDGGEIPVIIHETVTVIRASESEPSFDTSNGRRNFFKAVSSCDGLDGSVPK